MFAAVEAVSPELCPQPSAENLIWPGMTNPMTRRLADSRVCYTDKNMIYLRDSFLQRYERSNVYKCMPVRSGNSWYCSPSYGNQWGFEYCRRIGRNYIQVPVRELYKGVPDREILYAHDFAVNPAELSGIDQSEEHIMGKVQRFVDVLLRLGNGLAALGKNVGIRVPPEEWVRIERAKIEAEGWAVYPAFRQLSWVVPLDMPKTDFLDRCKVLHEILAERIPVGHLKKLLLRAGCRSESLERWGSIKLLQALLNIMEPLNAQCENLSAFVSTEEPNGFSDRNERMAMLFLNCDLRNADAHGNHTDWKTRMQERGFDISGLRVGHGRAFDFVFDGVMTSLCTVAAQIETLVATARPARRGSYLQ